MNTRIGYILIWCQVLLFFQVALRQVGRMGELSRGHKRDRYLYNCYCSFFPLVSNFYFFQVVSRRMRMGEAEAINVTDTSAISASEKHFPAALTQQLPND